MLTSRITPCLLLHKGSLVKTVNFKTPKYIGDPINAVKIFNEKEVDELIILDIDASVLGLEPNYKLISDLARECRMPLCYGGGIKSAEQAERIISLGVEKVAISSGLTEYPKLINETASRVGAQSIVAVLDVRIKDITNQKYEVFIHNGTKETYKCPIEFAKDMELAGAGELLVNSIDNDGKMCGYDIPLISSIRQTINIPITVLGGAGSYSDIENLIQKFGVIGAAAGSVFVFKGRYRAVLIQYPTRLEKIIMNGASKN